MQYIFEIQFNKNPASIGSKIWSFFPTQALFSFLFMYGPFFLNFFFIMFPLLQSMHVLQARKLYSSWFVAPRGSRSSIKNTEADAIKTINRLFGVGPRARH